MVFFLEESMIPDKTQNNETNSTQESDEENNHNHRMIMSERQTSMFDRGQE